MTTHTAPSLAFIDSFGGLIPCSVLEVKESGEGHRVTSGTLVVRVNATRAGYRRGEVVDCNAFQVVPRSCVRVRSGQYRIRTDYAWI